MSDTVATLLTQAGRRAQCKHWLESKGTTLWSDWDITDPDGLEDAVEWFLDQIEEFQRHVEMLAERARLARHHEAMRRRGEITETEEVYQP